MWELGDLRCPVVLKNTCKIPAHELAKKTRVKFLHKNLLKILNTSDYVLSTYLPSTYLAIYDVSILHGNEISHTTYKLGVILQIL